MKIKLLSAILAAALASAATADVTINFAGPQDLGGGAGFSVTTESLSGTLTGIIFHFEYSNAANVSWASDMCATVNEYQFGYFNTYVNGATITAATYQQVGAPQTGAAVIYTSPELAHPAPITLDNQTLTVGYGNSYGTGTCTMANVAVTLVGVVPGSGPYPPSVSGGTSTPASGPAGASRLLTVSVGPGGNPASAISSVTSDLSTVGGPSSAAFHDDGLNGDAAVDGIYSYNLAVCTGPGTVLVTATDGLARTGSGNLTVNAFVPTDCGEIAGLPGGVEQVISKDVAIEAAGQIKWLQFSINADVTGGGTSYLDLDTENTVDIADTELGVYRADGTLVASDDDDGSGNLTGLSFGNVAEPRLAIGGAVAGDGRDGDLLTGTHFVAVGVFNVTYGLTNFAATGAAVGTGNIVVNFRTNLPANTTDPYNPNVSNVKVLRATPGLVASGDTVIVTANVTPGGNPASTNLQVKANLTNIGGGAAVTMLDNGVAPDAAIDGIYTVSATGTGSGTQTVTVTASDDELRTDNAVGSVSFVIDAGTIAGSDADPNTADVITLTHTQVLGKITWMKFTLHDAVQDDFDPGLPGTWLDIDTEGTGADGFAINSLGDTYIGIFNDTGARVDNGAIFGYDDDSGTYYRSQLTFGDVAPVRPALLPADASANPGLDGNGDNGNLAAGTYYLALGNYACVIGLTDFNATTTNAVAAGDYVVNFRTNLPTAGCSSADIGIQGGVPGQDSFLDNNDFIVYIGTFFAMSPAADIGIQGGVPGHDNAWDNNDFIVYIGIFFTDTPNCTGP